MLALFLALHLHHPFMEALFQSFVTLPINEFPHFRAGFWPFVEYMARVTSDVLLVGISLAVPVGIITLIIETSFGLINRVAPQINAYFMAMPAKVIGGTIIFFFSLNMIIEEMVKNAASMIGHVQAAVQLME
jgi:flagellar biosynthetic protein FliR